MVIYHLQILKLDNIKTRYDFKGTECVSYYTVQRNTGSIQCISLHIETDYIRDAYISELMESVLYSESMLERYIIY